MDLPHSVQRRLAGILDGSAVHNWKALVAAVSEYTDVDARQFSTEEQQVSHGIWHTTCHHHCHAPPPGPQPKHGGAG